MHSLHPRVSADRNAGVDEDDFACRDFAKGEAFVDKPLVDDELDDFGLVREDVQEAGFVLFVFQLGVFLHQPLEPPVRHIRPRVELPFPAHQELDHSTNLAQVLGPVHAPPLPWRCEPPASMSSATWTNRDLLLPLPRSCLVSLHSSPGTRLCVSQETCGATVDLCHAALGDGLPLLWSKPVVQIRIVFSRGEHELLLDQSGSFHNLLDDLWDAPVHASHGSLLR